jgi:hypothetical protein
MEVITMLKIAAYSLSRFVEDYLRGQRPARSIKATVLHHTYRPRVEDYRGIQTIEQIRAYHVQSRGWRDIGANAYAAPDGTVYNARPLSYSNYAHAHISKAWNQVPDDVRALAYPDRQFFNHYAFGIETIGDFDVQSISPVPVALDTALRVLAAVHLLYKLPPERLFLHRDVANKSCPGNRVSRAWARRELAARMASDASGPDTSCLEVSLLPADGEMRPIPCRAALEEGVTRCDLRALAEALGYEVLAGDLPTTRSIQLRRADIPAS